MSSTSTLLIDSPKSIFGFEPIHATTPCGQQLRTQRSLLAELLQATTLEGPELAEEEDDENDFDGRSCMPGPTLRPVRCTCNVGHGVPLQFHARECSMLSEASGTPGPDTGALSSPIPIPTKTWFKTTRQVEERQRLQYQRQMYRMQQEQLMLAQQA